MKAMNGACVILVFVFATTFNVFTCFGAYSKNDQFPGSTWKVTILNYQRNEILTVHCKSKDDDLGVHVLKLKEQYQWEFKENLLQTTLFWCDFESKFGHTSFEVFWPENGTWLSERCNFSSCIWAADDKGFSLFNIHTQTFEFVHGWAPGGW